jgi:protein TonB
VPNCPECDQEAIKVVKSMPEWIPGKIKGEAVSSFFMLPIIFSLE